MTDRDFPHALARKWAGDYAGHLFLVIALRELVRRGVNRGVLRGLVTARAASLVETADELSAFGYHPGLGLAGMEAEVWAETVRYATDVPWLSPPAGVPVDDLAADLTVMQAAWDRFERFAGELPGDFCESSTVLAAGAGLGRKRVDQLFGPRVGPTAIVPDAIV